MPLECPWTASSGTQRAESPIIQDIAAEVPLTAPSPNRDAVLGSKIHIISLGDTVEIEEFVILLQSCVKVPGTFTGPQRLLPLPFEQIAPQNLYFLHEIMDNK